MLVAYLKTSSWIYNYNANYFNVFTWQLWVRTFAFLRPSLQLWVLPTPPAPPAFFLLFALRHELCFLASFLSYSIVAQLDLLFFQASLTLLPGCFFLSDSGNFITKLHFCPLGVSEVSLNIRLQRPEWVLMSTARVL